MIQILRGGNDAAVIQAAPVKSFVVSTVVCDNNAAQLVGAGQDLIVRRGGSTVFVCGHNIVAELAEELDRWKWEIFVGIKEHSESLHESCFAVLVLGDRRVNL